MADYQGHKCWAYWNVSLWLNNDEALYRLCQRNIKCYGKDKAADKIQEQLQCLNVTTTVDGARYSRSAIRAALAGM